MKGESEFFASSNPVLGYNMPTPWGEILCGVSILTPFPKMSSSS